MTTKILVEQAVAGSVSPKLLSELRDAILSDAAVYVSNQSADELFAEDAFEGVDESILDLMDSGELEAVITPIQQEITAALEAMFAPAAA